MAVCSLAFLYFCIAVVVVFHLAPGRGMRQVLLFSANALFLTTLVPNERSWAYFAAFLAGSYLLLALVRIWRRGMAVSAAIAAALVTFLYIKRFQFFSSWIPIPFQWSLIHHPVELVGLSYMLFKLVHLFVDEWQGQLAPWNLWTYLNYQLSFFTLTAGPIQRYNDFLQGWQNMDRQPREAGDNVRLWLRILTGTIKIGVLGAFALSIFSQAVLHLWRHDLASILTCFYLYPVYLYFNFSGYTDVMIGAAGLLGFRLPENFNHPYLARNILDFWDRWHITLTHWIRDYIFMSSFKVAATHFPKAARYGSYAFLFMAFVVVGVWHDASAGFLAFGALNGLGAAATRAYGDMLHAVLGRAGLQSYLRNPVVRYAAILVTLHYVCFCNLFFSLGLDGAMNFLNGAFALLGRMPVSLTGYSWQTWHAAPLVIAAVALTALWKANAIGSAIAAVSRAVTNRPSLLYAILGTQTMIVVFVLFFEWAYVQQEPPPVLYMAF
jgi:alginate O-acetyltransferase complex protein AlgI